VQVVVPPEDMVAAYAGSGVYGSKAKSHEHSRRTVSSP
jgi:hypothetical protein